MVSHVLGKSPAAQAGLHAFDILKKIDGEEIHHVNRVLQIIAALKPGIPVEVEVLRGSQLVTLTVTPGVRPKNAIERAQVGPAAIDTISTVP